MIICREASWLWLSLTCCKTHTLHLIFAVLHHDRKTEKIFQKCSVPHDTFFQWNMSSFLLETCFIFYSRCLQHFHYWHFILHSSLLWETVLYILPCLIAFLAFLPTLWVVASKLVITMRSSPEISKHHLGAKITPGWESQFYSAMFDFETKCTLKRFFLMLRMENALSHLLGKCNTIEVHPQHCTILFSVQLCKTYNHIAS